MREEVFCSFHPTGLAFEVWLQWSRIGLEVKDRKSDVRLKYPVPRTGRASEAEASIRVLTSPRSAAFNHLEGKSDDDQEGSGDGMPVGKNFGDKMISTVTPCSSTWRGAGLSIDNNVLL